MTHESSDTPIRVLIVEDNPCDAELISNELRRSQLECVTRRVEAEPELREALEEFAPHIVLADYTLPRFTGMRATRIVRSFDRDIPVILVSGEITEKVAIHCLQLGVSDYVLKDNLLRLGSAVRNALKTAQVRRAQKTEQAERQALEQMLWAITDSTADAMLVSDADGRIRFWNRAATDIFGFSAEEMLGEEMSKIVPERLRARHEAGLRAVKEGQALNRAIVPTVGLRKNGTEVSIELSLGSWEQGDEILCSAVVRDISDRIAGERERALLSAAVEQSSDLVIITDTDGTIQYVNRAFETITGYSMDDAVGRTPILLKGGHRDGALYAEMWSELKAGHSWTSDFVNQRKDGTEYHQRSTIFPIVDAEGHIRNFVGIGQDVTDRRSLEKQLRQAQKMEAIGQLTGGISHDFNNVLAAILTNAQLLTMSLPLEFTGEESEIRDIEQAAKRGSDLIKKLMAFSRDEYLDLEVVSPAEIIGETVGLLKRLIPENITVTVNYAHDGAQIQADRSGMQQILLNLSTNARDAMPEGGTIAISTRLTGSGNGKSASKQTPQVEISIRDTGAGMDAQTIERVFEPFFTTKDRGSGTGLGLAMVHTLVGRHGGTIEVESEPGVGTTFTMALPVAGTEAGASRGVTSAQDQAEPETKATVLLVEDEDPLRRAGTRALERFGYRVIAAENGLEALHYLEAHRKEVSLVVTDLIMPEMGGGELYEAVRQWESSPPFLIMTGYGPREVACCAFDDDVPVLRKPWGVTGFIEAVQGVLEER